MLNKIKDQVLHCLEKYSKTRDDDKALFNSVIFEFHRELIDNEGKIRLIDMYKLPSTESVRRCRQLIQNKEKKFMPLLKETYKKRGLAEELYYKFALQV